MQINLREHMPVHIIYATSRVNEEGRVELRPDVYGKYRTRVQEKAPRTADESPEAWP